MTNLNIALRKAWERLSDFFFEDDKQMANEDQIHTFIKTWLDSEPETNYMVKRFWLPLTEDEKVAALVAAIPKGVYCKNGWVLGDDHGNFLREDGQVSIEKKRADRFASDEEAKEYRDNLHSIPYFRPRPWSEVNEMD